MVWDIYVGGLQAMGLDLKPVWNQHHLPTLGGCPKAGANRPPAAYTWTHVLHISYTCRKAGGPPPSPPPFWPRLGRQTSDQFGVQQLQ